jgi:hypothetical protein
MVADDAGFPFMRSAIAADTVVMDFDEKDVYGLSPFVYVNGIPASAEPEEAPLALSEEELLSLSEADRGRLLALFEEERVVSAWRRTLHSRINFVHAQGSTDPVTVEQLDYLVEKERPLSNRRLALHREIDRLRELAESSSTPGAPIS